MSKHSSKEEYNAYMRDYMLRRYHRRRGQVIERLGGACAECGSKEGLEIDHKDAKRKSFSLARRLSSVSEAKLENEVKKCQLLCRRCHEEKSITDQGKRRAKGTHGTISAYRWCGPPKCDACKEANRKHMREYRRKRRAQQETPGS